MSLPFLRVATLNVLASRYALRERMSFLVELLRRESVDILLLQEVMRRKSGKVNITALLGDALGLEHMADHHASGRSSGNVTLSRYPLTKRNVAAEHPRMLVTDSRIGGRQVIIINNHGAWGSFAGGARLAEARTADRIARDAFTALSPDPVRGYRPHRAQRPIVIYGGDLNTPPDSAPIRYLTGRDIVDGDSTVWLDAWAAATPGSMGATITPTVFSRIEYGDRTDTPYLPERHPAERFDYLLVHEWSYGHAGEPLRARRFATETFLHEHHALTVSDHFGVIADLYLSPRGDETL